MHVLNICVFKTDWLLMLQAVRVNTGTDLNVENFTFTGMFGIMDGDRVEARIPLTQAGKHLHLWFLKACMVREGRFVGVPRGKGRSALPDNTTASLVLPAGQGHGIKCVANLPLPSGSRSASSAPMPYQQGKFDAKCVPFAVANCAWYHGHMDRAGHLLHRRYAGLAEIKHFDSMKQMADFVHDDVLGWQVTKLSTALSLPSSQLWPILAGVNESNGRQDHACVIMRNMIFDANEECHLALSQEHLNHICIGEDNTLVRLGPFYTLRPASKELRRRNNMQKGQI
jgi:hypothetical protein